MRFMVDKSRRKPVQYLVYDHGRYSESEFLQYLMHKNVIIVGPAGYLMYQGKGDWIDSFEVVVRVNHAIPIMFPEDYGSRTDVLYHILSHRNPAMSHKSLIDKAEVMMWKEAKIKWLVSRHSAISKRVKEVGPIINSHVPWCCMHHSFYTRAKQTIGEKSPNTGIAAIMHILSVPVKSLTIIGFDLYASGVYQGYGDVGPNEDASQINDHWHSKDAQLEYMRKLVRRDNRVKIDDHLKGILNA